MKRRFLAILTAFALMVTGIFPATFAFADAETDPTVPKLISVEADFPGAIVKWTSVAGNSNYEIQAALDENFTQGVVKWWPAKNATSVKIQGKTLYNNRKYFVRIKANVNGVPGPWSDVKSATLKTTTPGLSDKNVDSYRIGKSGVFYENSMPKTGEIKIDGNRYYFENGKFVAERELMWKGVKNAKSKTKYLVTTDCKYNWTYVYRGNKGNWVIYKRFRCTTGADKTPTPKVNRYKPGRNKIKFNGYNAPRKRKPYTCWFASRFQGSCFYHSVLYWRGSKTRVMSPKLGVSKSHGCIRLSLSDAYWMYRNIKKGTRIITFSNKIPKAK